MKTLFYGLSVALLCFATTTQATGPRVTSNLFEPPVNEIFALDFPFVLNSEVAEGGVGTAIIKAAFKAENVENTVTYLPLQTMLSYYLNEENALAIVGHDLNLTATETKNVISVPILNLKESYFYYRPKHETLRWKGNLSAFKGFILGVHQKDSSENAAYQKAEIQVQQGRLEARINDLIDGKLDLIRETHITMNATLDKQFAAQKSNIVRLEPNAGTAVISVIFNKKNPKGAEIAKQFQQGLAKIIASGEYNAIIKKQLGESSANDVLPLKK